MDNEKFKPEEITQTLRSFEGGLNAGLSPLLLAPNQMAGGMNTTVRGTFVHPRPPYQRVTLSAAAETLLASAFAQGKFQGGGYFRPDNGYGSIMTAIAGRAFQFTPNDSGSAVVSERTIPGNANPADQPQAWIWQAEKWAIWTDGKSNPVFIDGSTSTRSTYGTPVAFDSTITTAVAIPAVGTNVVVEFASNANIQVGDIVTFKSKGTMLAQDKDSPNPGTSVTLVNVTATPVGQLMGIGTVLTWSHTGTQLPPGRMGTYGLGRIWMSLIDGRQFVASDQVGGASGTPANNYRDAVLSITENLFLVGGGNFTVPGSPGDIRAMKFAATLNVSLGQGPLQIFTPNTVFSCQAPTDRSTWQNVTNPILTESVITNGGLSQNATVNVNNDILTRAIDGIRSMKISQQDFQTSWPTAPISFEVSPRLSLDSESTLGYSSAIVFDNRFLLTTMPKVTAAGVFWQAMVPLNLDPVSSLRGKAPALYDSLVWTGLNVFQLFVGQFGGVERAFALCWNEIVSKIELYELLKTADPQVNDNGSTRIVWSFDSASLFRDPPNIKRRYKRLIDGEIHVQNMKGTVDFQVYWKPDQWPCWVPWHAWRECAVPGTLSNPGFRPRMGLGEPSAPLIDPDTGQQLYCDVPNDRPLREGYTFQIMAVITGQCEFVEVNLKAVTIPEPEFARPTCCPERVKLAMMRQRVTSSGDVFAILDVDGKAILDVNDKAILQV